MKPRETNRKPRLYQEETKRKQQRRAELREAREMAESLVAESKAADLICEQEEREAFRAECEAAAA